MEELRGAKRKQRPRFWKVNLRHLPMPPIDGRAQQHSRAY